MAFESQESVCSYICTREFNSPRILKSDSEITGRGFVRGKSSWAPSSTPVQKDQPDEEKEDHMPESPFHVDLRSGEKLTLVFESGAVAGTSQSRRACAVLITTTNKRCKQHQANNGEKNSPLHGDLPLRENLPQSSPDAVCPKQLRKGRVLCQLLLDEKHIRSRSASIGGTGDRESGGGQGAHAIFSLSS
jgi:hypothetical protein